MLDKNQLNELAAMQRRYAEIYNSTGLAGFDKCYVHLSSKEFLETFNEFGTIDKNCEDYPVELYAVHLGVKFMCLLEKEEATPPQAGQELYGMMAEIIAEYDALNS